MNNSRPNARRGFTLVEMLVVIAIIAILAALITPAIFQAMWTARQTRIKTEVDQLASGIEAFKAKYGSYPPSNMTCPGGSANAALTAFVAKAFPRYVLSASTLGQSIANDLALTGTYQAGIVNTTNFNPQLSLVFWLSGLSPDVTDPFNRNNVNVTRTPFFTFDPTRLIDSNTSAVAIPGTTPIGRMVYNAPYGSTAYAYFDYQSYGGSPTSAGPYTQVSGSVGPVYMQPTTATTSSLLGASISMILTNGSGYVSPYFADVNNDGTIELGETFCKPQSFQIISAGQDGAFGTSSSTNASYFRLFPIGVGYDSAGTDNDNLTNFNEKSSLDAAKP